MKSRQLSNRLLVSMILVCCCQQIWAGLVVKGAKSKNSTTTDKATIPTTKRPKVSHKTKTATTTTTIAPELETTILPAELDLDGRSAFINNQYVADSESMPYTSPPLHELLQQQIETVLTNTDGNIQEYANHSPQMKDSLDNEAETQKPPGKPIFGYDMGQFDDYEEEETSEYEGEYTPENCEDTQESLGDYDQANLYNTEPNEFEHSTQSKPYDSSNYATQSNNNQESGSNKANSYTTQTNTNQEQSYGNQTPQNAYGSTKQMPKHNHNNNKAGNKAVTKSKPKRQHNSQSNYGQTKPKEQSQQVPANHYVQSKPLEYYGHNNQKPLTNQDSYGRPQQQQHQKPHYNTGKTPQNLYSNEKPVGNTKPLTNASTQQTKPSFSKPNPSLNTNLSYNSNYPSTTSNSLNNSSYNNSDSLNSSYGSFNPLTTSSYIQGSTSNTLNPSLAPNLSYGNNNAVTSTPFSGNNKPPHNGQKHHLTFRTVSSSTQYVSTPLADLMFKLSIGMAKSSNSKLGHNSVNNQAQVFNVLNDIDAKTE